MTKDSKPVETIKDLSDLAYQSGVLKAIAMSMPDSDNKTKLMKLSKDIGEYSKRAAGREVIFFERAKTAVTAILWMARRYANERMTYSPSMFNDAYDTLRDLFGDEVDNNHAFDMEGTVYYDISILHSRWHPYAVYGSEGKPSQSNDELPRRKFYKRPSIKKLTSDS